MKKLILTLATLALVGAPAFAALDPKDTQVSAAPQAECGCMKKNVDCKNCAACKTDASCCKKNKAEKKKKRGKGKRHKKKNSSDQCRTVCAKPAQS